MIFKTLLSRNSLQTPLIKIVRMSYANDTHEADSILEKCNVRPGQEVARECSTNIEYLSSLNMYSTANKMRLSGIVCTIGPVSRY